MTPDDARRFKVGERIQYVGPDDGALRPGELGTVIERGSADTFIVQFARYPRYAVRRKDERFRKVATDH